MKDTGTPGPTLGANRARRLRDLDLPRSVPFVLVHLAPLGVLWSGITTTSLIVCAGLYLVRMLAITAGYHRYFAHNTYKTSRPVQFLLAFMAQTSAQKGALWWASHHRLHHRFTDTEQDTHSPKEHGFWYAHMGWIMDHTAETHYEVIGDFAKYPELRWLNRHYLVPPALLAVATWALFGWSGLFVGFFASTVLLFHGTFAINSLAHIFGRRRFETKDESKNSFWLAVITCGEGWHNNHHHFSGSTRQGFRWWEIDISWYVLWVMARLGLVWDLKPVPARILKSRRPS